MSQRLQTADLDDYMKGKILDKALDNSQLSTRIFHFGIVIDNKDPQNINRIKVRIPLLDDKFYLNRTNDQGNELLPWSLPISRNLISTPENNSIIICAIFEPKNPDVGRMYFDSITNLSRTDILNIDRMIPESATYNNWDNIEQALNIRIKSKPKNSNEYNSKENVKYDIAIRGKGNNLLKFTKDSIELYQNKSSKESKLIINENIILEASDTLELLSKKGGKKYHPVFDKPLYDYLNEMNNMIKSIVITLNSQPSLNNQNLFPNLPSPSAVKLIPSLSKMYASFSKLKMPGNGASKQININ